MKTHLYHILATVSCWWLSSAWLAGGLLLNSPRFGLPPATDPDFANVVLLLHCDGVDGSTVFLDSGSGGYAFTGSNNAQIDTSHARFGTASLELDGNVNSIFRAGTTPAFEFSADFTIEFWVKPNVLSGIQVLVDFRPVSVNGSYLAVYLDGDGLRLYTNASDVIAGGTLTVGDWQHVALCRRGGTTRMFLGGLQIGVALTGDVSSYLCGSNRPIFGLNGYFEANDFNGRIDEIRFCNVALYGYNFVPPDSVFPDS